MRFLSITLVSRVEKYNRVWISAVRILSTDRPKVRRLKRSDELKERRSSYTLPDVLLIHPPSVYDFRERTWFTGPIARTVPALTPVFIGIPIGLISMGEYLRRHGYDVRVFNIAEKMLTERQFDVEHYLSGMDAEIFGIDLHWCVHSQGAIEIARICKKYHPNSLVILGGMTATIFHSEILDSFPFIDMVIRGEGEKPLLCLVKEIEGTSRDFSHIPNVTYKTEGRIRINRIERPCDNLDCFSFTALDLLEPKEKMLSGKNAWWHIPLSRGCPNRCVTCGGSVYSYRKYFCRDYPAFRSPRRVVEDLRHLCEQGVKSVFLFQDMRTGGEEYAEGILRALREEKVDIENLTLELFKPSSKEFLDRLTSVEAQLVYLTISPESGLERLRKVQGRAYSTLELIQFANDFMEVVDQRFVLSNFFMIGLPEENEETIRETWRLWKKLLDMNKCQGERSISCPRIMVQFDVLTFLDPGSLAYDFPGEFGYRLIHKAFYGYYQGMLNPSWAHWFSYETKHLHRSALVELTLNSWEVITELYEEHGFLTEEMTTVEMNKIKANRILVKELDDILRIKDPRRQTARLEDLSDAVREDGTVASTWLAKRAITRLLGRLKPYS